jgi:hypothetical protein
MRAGLTAALLLEVKRTEDRVREERRAREESDGKFARQLYAEEEQRQAAERRAKEQQEAKVRT